MAMDVVHELEAVEVEEEHAHHRPVSLGMSERDSETIEQQRAIRQPRQLVVQREVAQLRFIGLALCHVGRYRESGVAAVEAEAVRHDFNLDLCAVLGEVAPRPRMMQRRLRPSHNAQPLELIARPLVVVRGHDVGDAHRQELVARVTIVVDGSIVYREKCEGFYIPHPHRLWVVLEEQAVSSL